MRKGALVGGVLALLILSLAKAWVAGDLELYGDEAYYWQCGQRPALVYSDHPALTALLVRAGSELLGDGYLGVRLFFLLGGLLLPIAVFWMALAVVGRRDAAWAGFLALAAPGLAISGLLAVPDSLLLPLAACFLGAAERARRTGSQRWWLVVGVVGGLGLLTHYRFVLLPLALLAFLCVSGSARRRSGWRGPTVAVALWSAAAAPIVVYNLRHDLGPIRYYLAGRHGNRFDLGAIGEHFAGQALLVSPLLYVVLLAALWRVGRQALSGDPVETEREGALLFALAAVSHLGLFAAAIGFEDSGILTLHWPLAGYLPLLPGAAVLLRGLWRQSPWLRAGVLLTPALGLALTLVVLGELATGRLGLGSLRESFVGSERAVAHARELLETREGTDEIAIAADNYKLAAALDFGLAEAEGVFVFDHRKNHEHGRAAQIAAWGLDETGLREQAGREALVVVEWSLVLNAEHAERWIEHVASFFDRFEELEELSVESPGSRRKRRVLRYFQGRVRGPGTNSM